MGDISGVIVAVLHASASSSEGNIIKHHANFNFNYRSRSTGNFVLHALLGLAS
ncbi:MAG: hypothetical protein IJQ85_01245 [Selenomonadaceae bacterium]|nr:hypothetical protein [Selenomonadaceae bacterium]